MLKHESQVGIGQAQFELPVTVPARHAQMPPTDYLEIHICT